MAKRKKKTILRNLTIDDFAAEGKSIARKDGLVIFVRNAVAGDVVDVLITKKKKDYYEGVPIKFHTYSKLRTEPKCKHFGICGGCKWQNVSYQEQLKFKHKQVVEQIKRIGKIEPREVLPIIASDHIFYYRNKLEFTFSSRRWFVEQYEFEKIKTSKALGYHVPGMYDRVLDIEECLLQQEPSNKIRNELKKFAIDNKISFYDSRTHKGFLRNLIIRNNTQGEFMVIVIFAREEPELQETILDFIKQTFSQVVSIYYIINPKLNDSYADLEAHHYYGKKFLIENIDDLQFRIGAKSFFQTNTYQARKLYAKAKEFASISQTDVVYDLYTGTGTIALYLAKSAAKVIGIEIIPDAVSDAIENAKLNNIENVEFIVGDVKDILSEEWLKAYPLPDVIMLDPPRAGVHKDVLRVIKEIKPSRIVYISCNPATQARDINILSDEYVLEKIQPVDMFPHTHHIENIALLKLR